MNDFKPVPGLDGIVARMVAPEVHKIARRVEWHARKLAPPVKRWVSMADNRVRDTHRKAHVLDGIPDNLRFAVPGTDWDVAHGLSPGIDYLLEPRDTSTGLPLDSVQHVHCRCRLALDPAAIASKIRTSAPRIAGDVVTVEVICTAVKVVEAEVGETYSTGLRAPGTHFMGRAAARVAGTGGYAERFDPSSATGGGPGTPGQGDDE